MADLCYIKIYCKMIRSKKRASIYPNFSLYIELQKFEDKEETLDFYVAAEVEGVNVFKSQEEKNNRSQKPANITAVG